MNERYRLPFVAAVAVAVSAVVVAAVIVLGSTGSSTKSPDSTRLPSTVTTATATPTPAPTDPRSTPEGATRALFSAFNKGWLTDDPTLVMPYVTNTDSSAYLSVSGFLGGEKAVDRKSTRLN